MSLPSHQTYGRRPLGDQPLPGGLSPGLLRGRVHEVCGPARVALALMLLGASQGPVVWITASWLPERPYPCGMADYMHPGRVVFARARRPEDIQWAAEEALRSGAAPMVLIEMPSPPGLTPVRRLHLAAETGAEAAHHTGRVAPLGLLLGAGDGGAQGVESRWHMQAAPSPSGLLEEAGVAWRLERRRDRRAPMAAWSLLRQGGGEGASAGGYEKQKITAHPAASITFL
jgi:protein ImuA